MYFKIFFVIFVSSAAQQSVSQVCNETRRLYRETPETFRFSYIETYEEPCVIFCSVKTRKSVNVTSRMVQRYENITVNVCCEGYVEDTTHKGNGLYCKPVCDPPCQDGYCRKPNQCACKAGYVLDPQDPHICKPLCLKGCDIPSCISTNTPECLNNSSNTPESITPVCKKPCSNGVCIGPDICQCLPGFHQTAQNSCEAITIGSYSCEHGTLISPETCLCDLGYEWKCGYCHPICLVCDHGICLSPGHCKCDDGYIKNEWGRCVPNCSKGCRNGKCVGPDICICDPGWYKMTEDGNCTAHCDMNCDHGDCIAPNICNCHVGYQLYINRRGKSRCVPNRKDCKDFSSNPETCECDAPYTVSYFKDDGSDCNCVGACLNTSDICTKATCLFMNVIPDTTPPELDYDYDSEEDDSDEVSDLNVTKNIENDDTAGEVTTDQNNDHVDTTFSIVNREETIENEDVKFILPITESIDTAKTYLPNNSVKNRQPVKLSIYWIIGAMLVGVLTILVILGLVVKRKRCKTRSMKSGKDDISVAYNI